MKYCHCCGHEVADNAGLCPHCNAPQSPAQQNSLSRHRNIHCPECGGSNLSAIVETSIDGGTAAHTPVTRRLGITKYTVSNTHRNYWMCHDCGSKFRNLQNLKEEIAQISKKAKLYLIFCVISLLVAIMVFSDEIFRTLLGWAGILMIFFAIVFAVSWILTGKKLSNMQSEQTYLQEHCF